MLGFATAGVDITIAAPAGFQPEQRFIDRARVRADETGARLTVTDAVDVTGADVVITDEGAIMIDESGVRAADEGEEAEVTLTASRETFEGIKLDNVYGPEAVIDSGYPGVAPFTRGPVCIRLRAGWPAPVGSACGREL